MIEIRNSKLKNTFNKKTWYPFLIKSKNDLLTNTHNQNYCKIYEQQEIFYWMRIPQWIYQLNNESKINSFLDVGCAYGTLAVYTQLLTNCKTYCIDIDAKYISKKIISKYNINFKSCNVETTKIPFKEKFDLILLTDVIEHFNFNLKPTLIKLRDTLNDGGKIIISTPDSNAWGKVTKYYKNYSQLPMPKKGKKIIDDHIWQFNIHELMVITIESGFKIDKFDYSPGITNRHINLMISAI